MSKDRTITIEIDQMGNASIDLENFQGQGCAKVVADFRGGDIVTKAVNKREFTLATTKQIQKQGR